MSARPEGMPADTPDYMAPAWVSFITWALGNADVRAQFEAETGNRYSAPKDALAAMMDEATGYGRSYVEAFIPWANERLWGLMDDAEPSP